MTKYYFISYYEGRHLPSMQDLMVWNEVIDKHPLEWQVRQEKRRQTAAPGALNRKILINWVEISKENYNKYKADLDNR